MSKASCELPNTALPRDYPIVHHVIHTQVATRLRSTHSDSAHISHHSLCMEKLLLLNHGKVITVLNSSEHPPSWPHCPYYGHIITVMNSSEHPPSWPHCPFHGNIITGRQHQPSRITHNEGHERLLQLRFVLRIELRIAADAFAQRTSTQDKHIGQAHRTST